MRGGFAQTHYHSQFDNRDTYSREAFTFHHNLYGMLMLAYDQMALSPLDFTTRLEAMEEAIDDSVMSSDQCNALKERITDAKQLAGKAYEKVQEVNASYQEALSKEDTEKADAILKEYDAFNEKCAKESC